MSCTETPGITNLGTPGDIGYLVVEHGIDIAPLVTIIERTDRAEPLCIRCLQIGKRNRGNQHRVTTATGAPRPWSTVQRHVEPRYSWRGRMTSPTGTAGVGCCAAELRRKDDGILRCLDQADDVAVCIFHRSYQLPATDILDRLQGLCTIVKELLITLLDVVNMPVADRLC